MFEEPVDILIVKYYQMYTEHKDKIQNDNEFEKTQERKIMNKFLDAIVILHSNRNGRP
jgi:hypothetical protein